MKKAAIGLSVALNVILLVAAFGGYWALSSGYLIRLFIDPAHERWVSQFELLPVTGEHTVFVGDSITAGGAWHELFPDLQVVNRGIGGDVTTGVLARLPQIASGEPRQVFLLIGTNDLAFGVSEEEVVANVRRIVEEISAASPQTEIYVQSVLPRAVEYRDRVERLNQAVKDAVAGSANWIDLYPLFLADDGSIDDGFSNDELHLNGAGYLVWRDAIRDYVQ
ncbi:MAG: GDSL-type esterase/lipase family protein [Pseudomonadota bacterium]